MYAICIESSHTKGMGHLFRMLNFIEFLKKKNESYILIVNDDKNSIKVLEERKIDFVIQNLNDNITNWEKAIIQNYQITIWIDDRLDTDIVHSKKIKDENIKLVSFDNLGEGAELVDFNICGLFFNYDNLKGKSVLKGTNYLILNDEIEIYKKERKYLKNIIVSLGGSDTYGVTLKVLKVLKKYNIKATIHIGPSFANREELLNEINSDYNLISQVPSLIQEFSKYDLAITGGGITPFEANALGLPCLIIANEVFEIPNGEYLQKIGSSKFLGYYKEFNENILEELESLELSKMSLNGLNSLTTNGIENIYKEINK